MAIFVAAAAARFVNVAVPLLAVMFVAPRRIPVPPMRVAVTTRLSLVRTLLYWSSMRRTGCCAKGTPAVAELEGWVANTILLAGAGFTTVCEPVTGDLVPSLASDALTVWLPAVKKVIFKLRVPAINGVLEGSVAFGSLEATATTSVTVEI